MCATLQKYVDEGREEGLVEGEKKGRVEQAIEIYREMDMDEKTILQKIMSKFNMSLDVATTWLQKTANA